MYFVFIFGLIFICFCYKAKNPDQHDQNCAECISHSNRRLSKTWVCLFIFRHISLIPPPSCVVFELCLSSFLKILTKFGWAYFKYSEPNFNFFFSTLKCTKSEHFCGQIGERISGVKIGDAPPKSELLASLLILQGKYIKIDEQNPF